MLTKICIGGRLVVTNNMQPDLLVQCFSYFALFMCGRNTYYCHLYYYKKQKQAIYIKERRLNV